ncbi:MAG: signal peptide peptidase SppA [Bacteroidota bacterium]
MNFLKTYAASLLAVLTGLILLIPLSLLIFSGIVASFGSQPATNVATHSVLHLKLNKEIVENASGESFDVDLPIQIPITGGSFSSGKTGLFQLLEQIAKAKADENIDGIYLNMQGSVATGWANLTVIREALEDFKTTGKFVYAYSEIYSEGTYYLASTADKIFMPEKGGMEFNGLASSPYFIKGLFDKMELKPKVFKVGTFKSAVEPYIRKNMSPESKLQTERYLTAIWDEFAEDVAPSRGMSVDRVNELASTVIVADGRKALSVNLIDEIADEEEVWNQMKTAMNLEADKKLKLVSLKKYALAPGGSKGISKNKIAVVFAEGQIMMGKSSDGVMGSTTIVNAIRKARKDDNVKGIVLRVNSPGGQVLASDLIANEVKKCKGVKPIVVSMGNVAASGGYWISAHSDRIFAQTNTITGSIGIFGILYDAQATFNGQLGVSFDEVQTHPYANIGNPGLPWDAAEETFMQKNIEKGYSDFIHLVMEGRGFADSVSVDKIAQGRVWIGKDAMDHKLIDEFGDLQDAIAYVAKEAGVEEDYRLLRSPKTTNPMEEILKGMSGTTAAKVAEELDLAKEYQNLLKMRKMLPPSGINAMMPYSLEIR